MNEDLRANLIQVGVTNVRRIAEEARAGKRPDRDVLVAARQLNDIILTGLYSTRVVLYPPAEK